MTTAVLLGHAGASERDGGSFRDPSGYVFHRGGEVFRALTETAYRDVVELESSGLFESLQKDGLLVGTRIVDDRVLLSALQGEHPGFERFLRHERIATITYPYEWTLSMLGDAALHTLELQRRLLAAGWSLKDATAYNIQFVDGRPVFIDITSIERPGRLDVWYALGQFMQMFLFPSLLCVHHGWDLRSYFLGSLAGRDVASVARSLGFLERWGPRGLFDVTLPLLFEQRAARSPKNGAAAPRPGRSGDVQMMNLRRLDRKIRKTVSSYRPKGGWIDYSSTCNYTGAAEQAKKTLVGEMLETVRPASVLDIGCNTGDYSFLAAARGATVVAADSDHDAIDALYKRLRHAAAPITPMVVNLSDPSPAIGYMNSERQTFLGRVRPDCIVALALLHHLCVTGNLTLRAVCDVFAAVTTRSLILEHVPPSDSCFRKLVAFRTDKHEHLTLQACRDAFSPRFAIVREAPVEGTERTLMLLEKHV